MHSLTQATRFSSRGPTRSMVYLLWPAGAVLLLLVSTFSSQNITLLEFVYAGLLLSISIQGYISWSRTSNIRIPVWALVCITHFVLYGLAIFGARRRSSSVFDHGSDLP